MEISDRVDQLVQSLLPTGAGSSGASDAAANDAGTTNGPAAQQGTELDVRGGPTALARWAASSEKSDLASLEASSSAVESLGLGFHLGAALERIGMAAGEGSRGTTPLREAIWLIERYVELLQQPAEAPLPAALDSYAPPASPVATPEPAPLFEPIPLLEPEPYIEPVAEAPEPFVQAEPFVPAEPLEQAEPVALAEPEPEPEPFVQPEPFVLPEPEPQAEPVAFAEPELGPEPFVRPEPEQEPVAFAEPEPFAHPEPEPVALAEPEPETFVHPEPEPFAQPEPVAVAEPAPTPSDLYAPALERPSPSVSDLLTPTPVQPVSTAVATGPSAAEAQLQQVPEAEAAPAAVEPGPSFLHEIVVTAVRGLLAILAVAAIVLVLTLIAQLR